MIQLHDVSRSHHRGSARVDALSEVTARIPEGAFAFIVGPSGSGKSTLLYLIGALDECTGGHISVAGRRLDELTTHERDTYRRETIGFIFQSFNLLTNLTAVENVLVPFLPGGISASLRARAVDLLGTVGLGDRVEHRPSELSGGEQQRVAIARALLKEPAILLADEPTGELDSRTGAAIVECLRARNREDGTTVVVVTHDTSYIRPDDVVLRLQDGRINEQHQPPSASEVESA